MEETLARFRGVRAAGRVLGGETESSAACGFGDQA